MKWDRACVQGVLDPSDAEGLVPGKPQLGEQSLARLCAGICQPALQGLRVILRRKGLVAIDVECEAACSIGRQIEPKARTTLLSGVPTFEAVKS